MNAPWRANWRTAAPASVAVAGAALVLAAVALPTPGGDPAARAPADATTTHDDGRPDAVDAPAAPAAPAAAAVAVPAPPVVVAQLGSWVTDGHILAFAGGTVAPGDNARLEARCGPSPCAAADTSWTVDGRALAGNPVTVTSREARTVAVDVSVAGRADPPGTDATVTFVARALDVPADGWATGAPVDHDAAATAYADAVGWLPRCDAPGASDGRRTCPRPPDAPPAAADADDDGDQAASPDGPGGDACSDGVVRVRAAGRILTQPGVEPGCVTREHLQRAGTRAAGRPVPLPCPANDGCRGADAATVADAYAVAAHVASAPTSPTGCAAMLTPAPDCTPAMENAVHAGAPAGPALRGPDAGAHRADVAALLAWATGTRWLLPDHVNAASPAAGAVGGTATLTAAPTLPDGWASATVEWPDVDGATRACAPRQPATAAATCTYEPSRSGLIAVPVRLVGPGGQAITSATVIVADPIAPALDVTAAAAPDGTGIDLDVAATTPASTWAITRDPDHARDAADRRVNGDGWAAHLVRTTATHATVRVVGTAPDDLHVAACTAAGCGTAPLAHHTLGPASAADATTGGADRAVVAADGPVDVPADGWTLTRADPALTVLHRDPATGDLAVAMPGTHLTGDARVATPPWWSATSPPATVALTGPAGTTREVCVAHPDATATCDQPHP